MFITSLCLYDKLYINVNCTSFGNLVFKLVTFSNSQVCVCAGVIFIHIDTWSNGQKVYVHLLTKPKVFSKVSWNIPQRERDKVLSFNKRYFLDVTPDNPENFVKVNLDIYTLNLDVRSRLENNENRQKRQRLNRKTKVSSIRVTRHSDELVATGERKEGVEEIRWDGVQTKDQSLWD